MSIGDGATSHIAKETARVAESVGGLLRSCGMTVQLGNATAVSG
jgi:hypothetical protein